VREVVRARVASVRRITMAANPLATVEKKLRAHGLKLPEAYEEFPWGDRALKVNKKVFVFMGYNATDGLSVTVKLGAASDEVLQLPFTAPTGYGLGKSGWVTARFAPGEKPPVEILCDWIEESYRLVAPKKLVALLEE
jgi:predicted DNA-binding protein (MmcQ/YjbR family)